MVRITKKDCWTSPLSNGGLRQGAKSLATLTQYGKVCNSAIREAIQNSLDASLHKGPVVVEINRATRPLSVIKDVWKILEACDEGVNTNGIDEESKKRFKAISKALNPKDGVIPVLAIRDHGTTGLIGSNLEEIDSENHYSAFMFGNGISSKDNKSAGGSFGYGKNSIIGLSSASFIGVSTVDTNKIEASGMMVSMPSRMTRNGDVTSGIMRYDRERTTNGHVKHEPISSQITFGFGPRTLTDTGTDIYLPAVNMSELGGERWAERCLGLVLVNFLVAIWKGDLEVEFGDEDHVVAKLNCDTLPMHIDSMRKELASVEKGKTSKLYGSHKKDVERTILLYETLLSRFSPNDVMNGKDVESTDSHGITRGIAHYRSDFNPFSKDDPQYDEFRNIIAKNGTGFDGSEYEDNSFIVMYAVNSSATGIRMDGRHHYVRGGMYIDDYKVRARTNANAMTLTIIDSGSLSGDLRMMEDVSHSNWSADRLPYGKRNRNHPTNLVYKVADKIIAKVLSTETEFEPEIGLIGFDFDIPLNCAAIVDGGRKKSDGNTASKRKGDAKHSISVKTDYKMSTESFETPDADATDNGDSQSVSPEEYDRMEIPESPVISTEDDGNYDYTFTVADGMSSSVIVAIKGGSKSEGGVYGLPLDGVPTVDDDDVAVESMDATDPGTFRLSGLAPGMRLTVGIDTIMPVSQSVSVTLRRDEEASDNDKTNIEESE